MSENKVNFITEADKEFKKEFPVTFDLIEESNEELRFCASDLQTVFRDAFLCGMLWWKPILTEDYVGHKSELQLQVENGKILQFKNKDQEYYSMENIERSLNSYAEETKSVLEKHMEKLRNIKRQK